MLARKNASAALSLLASILLLNPLVLAQLDASKPAANEARVESILSKMTPEEKIDLLEA